jgi:DNA-directed RNA polymerase specialized sigma24 family protein
MILHDDDLDPGMRYEGLYRFAFDNCRKQEDPWEEATQNHYTIFMQNDVSEAKTSLYRILHKLIFDNYKNEKEIKAKLLKIEIEINQIKSERDAISILDNIIKTLK